MTEDNSEKCSAVVIGRNEGPRLKACLRSLAGQVAYVVYVDSGSSDNSLEIARGLKAEIVDLDLATPFTAARARNAGFERLIELHDGLSYVQFVDGDCVVVEDWVGRAVEFLEQNTDVAVACGRLRERFPENSVYNKLCDIEWDAPVGKIDACGGIAMVRTVAFASVDGFKPDLIAGEEPELCVRLRGEGWKIWRVDVEMATHDADINTFGQWWTRAKRGGYAYALGASLHGAAPEHHGVKEVRRALLWSALFPIAIVLGMTQPIFSLLLLIYPLQVLRLAWRRGAREAFSWVHGFFLTAEKFPESAGIVKFYLNRLLNRCARIIEYK